MSLDKLFSELKSQGFHGHAGRPGKRGGSLPKGGGGISEKVLTALQTTRNVINKKVIDKELSDTDVKGLEKDLKSSGFNKVGREESARGSTTRMWRKGNQSLIIHRSYMAKDAGWSVSVTDHSDK